MTPKTTDDVRSWIAWSGDIRPDSEVWICDGRTLLRIAALDPQLVQQLRAIPGTKHVQRRELVDEHDFEQRAVNIAPVDGMDSEDDSGPSGSHFLSAGERTWCFANDRVTFLAWALPGAELYVGSTKAATRQDGSKVPAGHVLLAKRNGELVGLLMGVEP